MESRQRSKRIILASASPRRRDLLGQIGLNVRVIPSTIAETVDPALTPLQAARALARSKAVDVASGLSSGMVIGADTLVVVDGQALGKPGDEEEAEAMLKRLSGRTHEVITALALVDAATGAALSGEETTKVFFRTITEPQIRSYIASGEPMDKAGAYGIQGKGVLFVARIEGCYTNVVGLPLPRLTDLLSQAGCWSFNQEKRPGHCQ